MIRLCHKNYDFVKITGRKAVSLEYRVLESLCFLSKPPENFFSVTNCNFLGKKMNPMNPDYSYFYSNNETHGVNHIKIVYNEFQQTEN